MTIQQHDNLSNAQWSVAQEKTMLKPSAQATGPCHIVITGGAGFLGVRLARTLLAQGQLSRAGAAPVEISRITLVDRAAPPDDLRADARVSALIGDLNELLEDKSAVTPVVAKDTAIVFHLAAAV